MYSNNLLTLDFETRDPYLSRGLGPGWTFAINYPEKHDFKVLGAAIRRPNGNTEYIEDLELVCQLISDYDGLIMHNAIYDYGIIKYGCQLYDIPLPKHLLIYDTMILAKLTDCTRKSYSLENLAKHYRISLKESSLLSDYVYESGLYAQLKKQRTGKNFTKRPVEKQLLNIAYENLDLIDSSVVAKYAIADVQATTELFFKLIGDLHYLDLTLYSDIIKVCTDIRTNGIRVDLDRARTIKEELEVAQKDVLSELYELCGQEFNINSPKQCVDALTAAKVSGFPVSKVTGNKSVAKDWLEAQPHEACKKLVLARKLIKLSNDFVTSILDSQEYTDNDGKYGRVFSTLNPLGAAATGRFSSNQINIQQIPKRDPKWGKLIRSIFLPEGGQQCLSCDFSNQEPRLQVNDAALLACDGGKQMLEKWKTNAKLDYHQAVADLAGIDRTAAKTINLGLSYGMGEMKLCKQLGLPTEHKKLFLNGRYKLVEVAGLKGKNLIKSYHEMVPYVKQLTDLCQDKMQKDGYITTIGGRRLNHGGFQENIRKALNKRIQGSAADQILKSLVLAWKAGLHLLCSVHDEINISYSDDTDKALLVNAMENAYDLDIPMVADVESGNNWGMINE